MFRRLTQASARSVTPPPSYNEPDGDVTINNPNLQSAPQLGDTPGQLSIAQQRPTRIVPPIPEPVELTWRPEDPGPGTSNDVTRSIATTAVTYTFSQIGNNSMLLLPPQDASNSRPLYHISWTEDFFITGNFITTIRRGGNADGQFVGMFDLKGGIKKGIVHVGPVANWLPDALGKVSSKISKWHFNSSLWSSPRLFWDKKTMTCTMGPTRGGHVARFISADDNTSHIRDYVDKLEVQPAGQFTEVFDEILISLLIVERQKQLALAEAARYN